MRNTLLAIITASTLTACATNFADKDPASVAAAVVKQQTKFDPNPVYISPNMEESGLLSSHHVRLFRTEGSNGLVTGISVMFIYTGGGWAFYETASMEGGRTLELENVDRQVFACSSGTCTYKETTHARLPVGYLESAAESGFQLRYNAKRGNTVVTVPPNFIKGFLAAIPAENPNRPSDSAGGPTSKVSTSN